MKRLVMVLAVFALPAAAVSGCGGGGSSGGGGGGGSHNVTASPSPTPSPGTSPSPSPTPSPGSSPSPSPSPGSGPGTAAILPGQLGALAVPQIFPANDDWNTDISDPVKFPVLPLSGTYIGSVALPTATTLHPDFGTVFNGAPIGIPFVVVSGTQALQAIDFMFFPTESNPGPYPLPPNTPIEGVTPGTNPPPAGAGDQHALVIDRDHMMLYEVGIATPPGVATNNWATDQNWSGSCGAVWDLTKVAAGQRPIHWTSADAAGLPIFAGLARYDEIVTNHLLTHALRVTVGSSQDAFYSPASHQAGTAGATGLPPMGLRMRLKASFVIATTLPAEVQVLLTGMKKYGLIVADNGSPWYISGAPDSRWSDSNLHSLNVAKGSDFECVDTGAILTH